METVVGAYNTLFYERADPRVKDWLLMTSPWPVVAIVSTYLIIIKVILPRYMRFRKPYELRNVIKWYNIMQIISNAVVTWGLKVTKKFDAYTEKKTLHIILHQNSHYSQNDCFNIMTSGWTTTYHFGCVLPDYSMNPEPLRMLRFLWWTIILKLLEMLETVFFVLRKRDRQASFLHIYHHASSFIIIWIGVKYIGGGLTSFSPMLNNAVHVIMYTYYFLASEGSPNVKAVLAKYKKWLTIMQMVQFNILILYSAQMFLPSCPAPLGIAYLYFPNVIFVYYMFYRFFKENYCKSNSKKDSLNMKNGIDKIK